MRQFPKLPGIFVSTLFLLILSCNIARSEDVILSSAPMQVFFCLNEGCIKATVKAIDSAKESVYAQNYSFNSEPVARALARANKRCHKVIVILDQSQLTAKNTMLPLIGKAGIETYVDKQHAIATSRSMVIDGHIVISGSFSLATSEDFTSADSTLIVDSRESAKQHYDNFMAHKSHCVRYNY